MTSHCHFCHIVSTTPAWAFKCPLTLVTFCLLLTIPYVCSSGTSIVYWALLLWTLCLCLTYLPECCRNRLYPPEFSLVFVGLPGTQLWIFSATGLSASFTYSLFIFSEMWQQASGIAFLSLSGLGTSVKIYFVSLELCAGFKGYTNNAGPVTGENHREAHPCSSSVLGSCDPFSDFGESNLCSKSVTTSFWFPKWSSAPTQIYPQLASAGCGTGL